MDLRIFAAEEFQVTDASNLAKEADFAADQIANKATSALRRQAYEEGWPVELSRGLSISHNGSSTFFIEDHPDELKSAIDDLEMGTQDNPPMSTKHRFMNRFDKYSDDYDSKIGNLIDGLDIF